MAPENLLTKKRRIRNLTEQNPNETAKKKKYKENIVM